MKDVQELKDLRNIPIQKAGVKAVRLPFLIFEKSGTYQQVCAEVSLCADLPADTKGTHMSRFMEILNKWSKKKMSSCEIKTILEETVSALNAKSAEMNMSFLYFIEKTAPVTSLKGYVDYNCGFRGIYDGDFRFFMSMEVPVTTLCPCSKEISSYGAHNQRAIVKINLSYEREEHIWLEDLALDIGKLGSAELFSVLKRPDEKQITESAYENPKFVEDVVRDVVLYAEKLEGITFYDIECEALESIHKHNAFASITSVRMSK